VVANTVAGKIGEILIGKITKGGVFASIVGPPANAKEYSSVRVVLVYSTPDSKTLTEMARAVVDKKFVIPIGLKLPLRSASEGHVAFEKGGIGKVLLMP
jgi:ADP-glucose pyrophosphorylase